MALLNFDATNVPQNQALDPLPAGWYNVVIAESEIKPTKDGQGAYLQLTMEIMDGQFAKRKLFDRLNLQNNNAVAVEIAYKTLSAICHSVGVIQCQDSQQLHGRPMQVKVSLKAASHNDATGQSYEASNEVKGYKAVEGAQATQATSAPQWAPQQAAPVQQAAPQSFIQAPVAAPATPWGAPPQQPAAQPAVQPGTSAVLPWGAPAQAAPAQAPAAAPAPSGVPPWQQQAAPAAPAAGTPPWGQR